MYENVDDDDDDDEEEEEEDEDDDVEEDGDADDHSEDEVEDDKVEDDVEKVMIMMLRMIMLRKMMKRMIMLMLRKMRWRLMMLRMMRSRRRKMLRLRMMMLPRRADPKTGTHTLCEPAQSKCTWTFHKSHFTQKFTGQMSEPRVSPERRHTLCAACAVEIHLDISQQPLYTDMYRKKSGAQSDRVRPERGHTLCASLRSRNALGHFRANLCENLQGKCWGPV